MGNGLGFGTSLGSGGGGRGGSGGGGGGSCSGAAITMTPWMAGVVISIGFGFDGAITTAARTLICRLVTNSSEVMEICLDCMLRIKAESKEY